MGVGRLPTESAEYVEARAALEAAEIELVEQRERVATLRRELPLGPIVEQEYAFEVTDLADASG